MKMQAQYKNILILGSLVFLSLQVLKAETACCGDAQYDSSVEDCCGGAVVPIGHCCSGQEFDPKTEECCGNEVINPSVTESIGYTLSVSELLDKAQEATENLSVNGTGCGWSDVGELEVNITGSKRKKCCDYGDGIESSLDIYKVEGSGNFNLGTFACRYNALSTTVPEWLAQAYAEVSVSFSINLGNIDFETDCEEPTVCHGPVSGDVNITGCLGGELAQGIAQISCGIEGTGSIGTKLCFGADGFSLSDQYAQVEDVVIFGQFLVGDIEAYRVEHSLLNN